MTTFTDGYGGDIQTYIDNMMMEGSPDDNCGVYVNLD